MREIVKLDNFKRFDNKFQKSKPDPREEAKRKQNEEPKKRTSAADNILMLQSQEQETSLLKGISAVPE